MASVKKRTWVTKEGRKTTAWVARWSDPNVRDEHGKPKRHQEQFRTMKEAEAFRRRIEMDFATGEHVSASAVITVRDLCERYIRHSEDRCRDGRIGKGRLKCIKQGLVTSIIPALGNIHLTALTIADIESAYRKMCLPTGGKLAPVTAKQRIIFLKMAQDYAIVRGLMKKRPVSEALKELRGVGSEDIRVFETEEVKKLLSLSATRAFNTTERASLMLCCIVHLAACCGLRYGEIMGLRRKNLDLKAHEIRVRDNLTPLDGLKGPKTKSGRRDLPLPERLVPLLKRWLDEFYVENKDDLVFRTWSGGDLLYASFHTWGWRKLLKRAGLNHAERPFHFHALRHYYASALINAGVALPDVAEMMGHAKVDVTMKIYAHALTRGQQRNEAVQQVMGGLVSPEAFLKAA